MATRKQRDQPGFADSSLEDGDVVDMSFYFDLLDWLQARPMVKRVLFFGGRSQGRDYGDIDLALELDDQVCAADGFDSATAAWSQHRAGWAADLQTIVKHPLDLHLFNGHSAQMQAAMLAADLSIQHACAPAG